MEFKVIATLIALLLSLVLMTIISSKFTSKTVNLSDIIESAKNGKSASIRMSPQADIDVCNYVGAKLGCDGELGANYCDLQKGRAYWITADPTDTGVCLTIKEVGE